MGRLVKRVVLGMLGLLVVALLALAAANAVEAARRDRLYLDDRLGPAEKAELREVLELKRAVGDEVWPGLAGADIPLILFNDRYEFLVGLADPPGPWEVVDGDDFEGQPYHRRVAGKPQAFAVPVGDRWAGSLGQLERMNREYLLGVRRQLPPVLAELFPYPFATLTREFHLVAQLHEAFHAHQAALSGGKLARADARHSLEGFYPFGVAAFEEAWNAEGRALASALRAPDDAAARSAARAFLESRAARRANARLSADLVAFERELEWEEGLAKHVEIRFHEAAAARGWPGFEPGLAFWQEEFARIDGRLGEGDGDYRFYLSGMAQARLLDRLAAGWTTRALGEDVSLEDLLSEAAGKGS